MGDAPRACPGWPGTAKASRRCAGPCAPPAELGIEFLTLYAFSSENWQRPSSEVSTLMSLLERSIERELPELMEQQRPLPGDRPADGVPAGGAARASSAWSRRPPRNTGLNLVMAFNYGGARRAGGRLPRARAARCRAGTLRPEEIDEARVAAALYTDGMPDPDLLIRTSGEMRVSNFLLWQIAYTELWVTPTLWPDFGARDLFLAVADFQQRDRRFGKV